MVYSLLLQRAVFFASEAHRNQQRKITEHPYIVHPAMVATLIASHTTSDEVLAAALLHDTVEDTDTSLEEIQDQFGDRVTFLVDILSENKDLPYHERKKEYFERLLASEDHDVFLIKTADILYNLHDIFAILSFDKEHVDNKVLFSMENIKNYFDTVQKYIHKMYEAWPENPLIQETMSVASRYYQQIHDYE